MSCKQLCLWPRRIKYEGPGGKARRGEEKQRFQEKERIVNGRTVLPLFPKQCIIIILIPFITLLDFYFEQIGLRIRKFFFSFKAEYSLKSE